MNLTLTGIDAHTRLLHLPSDVELGILFTMNPKERNRYPDRKQIQYILQYLDFSRLSKQWKIALHVCGEAARRQLLAGEIGDILTGVSRIQVNGRVSAEQLQQICKRYPHPRYEIITQHFDWNLPLLDVKASNHSILVDGSGGRGICPDEWMRPDTEKKVGFAGGLGPENLAEQLPLIHKVAVGEYWVDMESKLRDENDWFSTEKANAVAAMYY